MDLDKKMRKIRQIIGKPIIFAVKVTSNDLEIVAMDVDKKGPTLPTAQESNQVYIG